MTESFKRMKLKEEQEQQHSRCRPEPISDGIADNCLDATRIPERSASDIDTEATFM